MCCTYVSRSHRPATALTAGRPPSYGQLGEDGPERLRDKNTGGLLVFGPVTGVAVRGDMALMLVERRREDMAASAGSDEIELGGLRRVQHRLHGGLAGMRDRPRRQAGDDIGIIRGIAGQIARGEAL